MKQQWPWGGVPASGMTTGEEHCYIEGVLDVEFDVHGQRFAICPLHRIRWLPCVHDDVRTHTWKWTRVHTTCEDVDQYAYFLQHADIYRLRDLLAQVDFDVDRISDHDVRLRVTRLVHHHTLGLLAAAAPPGAAVTVSSTAGNLRTDPQYAAASKAALKPGAAEKSALDARTTSRQAPLLSQHDRLHWIEIELLGEDDQPIPFEAYQLKLPDGTEVEGRLDGNGFARHDGIAGGTSQIRFPCLDKDAWQFLESVAARKV
jgi:hypothetical protein